jgi:hypothetical protein
MPTLKFIVIPTKNTYEEYSEEIVSKIKDVENCTANIDNNYTDSMNSRVNKYKKNNKNIITIGLSEVEHNTIMIHFNGIRPKTMELDEFISLLESYENEDEDDDEDDSSSSSSEEDVGRMFQKEKNKKDDETNKKESEESEESEDGCIIC